MKGDMNIDFVMGVVLFVSVYAIIYIQLPSSTVSFRQTPDPLTTASYYFSDVIATTPGIPANWTTVGEMTRIGLAYGTNFTSYPNIIDIKKAAAIDGQACSSLKAKTTITLNFAIIVNSNFRNYSCTATIPKVARLIERMGYLKNGTAYSPATIKTWTW
jgi:hypothetical protein